MPQIHHRVGAVFAALIAAAVLAPGASAAIAPAVTLTQTVSQAGSASDVSLDLTFAPTGTDSPKDLTVALPPGLLADASIDAGACLQATTAVGACQIGSGTVSATLDALSILGPLNGSLALPVSFYLVAPPSPADLAGVLTVANPGTPLASDLGSPADVMVRSSGDPAGVGLTERFTNLPNTFTQSGVSVPISVNELNSTFTALRLPTSCAGSTVSVSADSYADATSRSASAPLTVTGCSALPFAPVFGVSATRDLADSGTQVVTDITQKPGEAASRSVTLTLPPSVLAPNAAAVLSNGLLCTDPTFATCKAIGSASSTSPLYPKALAGSDYLTGSLTAPAITIRFPPPFALTIRGAVTLATGTTAFTNLPDIPLTDLKVTLSGGPAAAFAATCNPAGGTATSSLVTQNGDRSVTSAAPFTVANCTTPAGGSGSGGGGGNGGRAGVTPGQPTLRGGSLTGIGRGRPTLRFTAVAGTRAAQLSVLTIALPRGLRVATHRRRRRFVILGVALTGASVKSLAAVRGRLVIRLRRSTGRLSVTLRPAALHESAALRRQALAHRVHRVTLGVSVTDAVRHTTRLTLVIRRIRL